MMVRLKAAAGCTFVETWRCCWVSLLLRSCSQQMPSCLQSLHLGCCQSCKHAIVIIGLMVISLSSSDETS